MDVASLISEARQYILYRLLITLFTEGFAFNLIFEHKRLFVGCCIHAVMAD
jgi:hypothetical protein